MKIKSLITKLSFIKNRPISKYETKYYLETNSLYALANILKYLSQSIRVFTSALSIIEIISGMTEQNFVKRRNILRKVMNSSICIDWQRPEAILLTSFKIIDKEDVQFVRNLKSLCRIIIKSKDLLDVKNKVDRKKLNEVFEFCTTYDKYAIRTLSNSFSEHGRIFRENVGYHERLDFHANTYSSFSMRKELLSFIIENFADNFSNCEDLNSKNKTVNMIVSDYDGNAKYFLEASCYYAISKQTKSEFTAKNDYFDLAHFIYLRGRDDFKIVSNDKLIVGICKILWPEKIVNIKELKG